MNGKCESIKLVQRDQSVSRSLKIFQWNQCDFRGALLLIANGCVSAPQSKRELFPEGPSVTHSEIYSIVPENISFRIQFLSRGVLSL